MDISLHYGHKNASEATGLTVVIDVFRAFSTACYVFAQGANMIIPVGDIDTAFLLKKEHPDFILMGERNGAKLEGFDFGNSPHELRDFDFTGKTVVHTTTAGTQGIVKAVNATEIITGSFVNAAAVTTHIHNRNPSHVSIICTGTGKERTLDEDELCALWLKNELSGAPNDFKNVIAHLKEHGFADYFYDPKVVSHPLEDLEMCLALNRFGFVLQAVPYRDGLDCLQKIAP